MSIIVYPKQYFGNSDAGKEKQYKWTKQLVKFSSKRIRILPSQSKIPDAVHGLDYGLNMSVKKALLRQFFQRYSTCGCGFEYSGENKEFIEFLEPYKIKSTKNVADTKKEINNKKAVASSQITEQTEEEIDHQIDLNFYSSDKSDPDNPIIKLSSGFQFATRSTQKSQIRRDAKVAFKRSSVKASNNALEEFTELYSVEDDNNILLRKAVRNYIIDGVYNQEYLLYSYDEKIVLKITKKFQNNNDYLGHNSIEFDTKNKNDLLYKKYHNYYKNFNPSEVYAEWKNLQKIV